MSQQPNQLPSPEKAAELYRLWCHRNIKDYIPPDLGKTEKGMHKGKPTLILRAAKGYKLAIIGFSRKGLSVLWGNSFPTRRAVSRRNTRLLNDEWVLAVN